MLLARYCRCRRIVQKTQAILRSDGTPVAENSQLKSVAAAQDLAGDFSIRRNTPGSTGQLYQSRLTERVFARSRSRWKGDGAARIELPLTAGTFASDGIP